MARALGAIITLDERTIRNTFTTASKPTRTSRMPNDLQIEENGGAERGRYTLTISLEL